MSKVVSFRRGNSDDVSCALAEGRGFAPEEGAGTGRAVLRIWETFSETQSFHVCEDRSALEEQQLGI